MKTFETIRRAAEDTRKAPAGMFQYTMAAAENAAETIYVDKETSLDEYDTVALRSLESILCDSFIPETDEAARKYFTKLGVRY